MYVERVLQEGINSAISTEVYQAYFELHTRNGEMDLRGSHLDHIMYD